jgi:transcriptional regulator GlxA family with amidase domain
MWRSRFAERFREPVGSGPMGYLTDRRLQKARLLLGQPRASVKEVGYLTGYRSPAAFSRAYAQKFGHPSRAGGV